MAFAFRYLETGIWHISDSQKMQVIQTNTKCAEIPAKEFFPKKVDVFGVRQN
jgi:hypothetical protein